MNKILLIMQREYLTRVRKKSFVIMSIVGPLLIAAIYIIPIWAATSGSAEEETVVKVFDESGFFSNAFPDEKSISFIYTQSGDLDSEKTELRSANTYRALLHIPAITLESPRGITLFSEKSLSPSTESSIRRILENHIENMKLEQAGIAQETLSQIKTKVSISTISITEKGESDSSTGAAAITGLFAGLLIYFFTFLYGAQVMQGVIEEKSNRIIEVMISSVKPFQLMMGKIVGVAAVGLTQVAIWIVLGFVVIAAASSIIGTDTMQLQSGGEASAQVQAQASEQVPEILKAVKTINFPLIIGGFIFYFLFGYLTYAALFGAIGAAVDNASETQQFMFPVTAPLIIAIVMSSFVVASPNGSIAFWLSMIPLTSPVIMMIRLPFIGFGWELLLSMLLLVGGFLFFTWMAAKIYRVGILMYGKKVNFKELGKWLNYKY